LTPLAVKGLAGAMPASPPPALVSLRLPKSLESDPEGAIVQAALRASARPLWARGALLVPGAGWTPALAAALATAQAEGALVRGLEQVEKALQRQARGLSLADARSATPRGARVSRLLLVSNDGSERFYRNVEQLVSANAERLLPIRVDADSTQFAAAVREDSGVVRALMIDHKELVVSVLRALYT
jgi:hypothetical protein